MSFGNKHPGSAQLERFMRGELSRVETRPIVRHLLIGCPRCSLATRRLWHLGERSTGVKVELAEAVLQRSRGGRRMTNEV